MEKWGEGEPVNYEPRPGGKLQDYGFKQELVTAHPGPPESLESEQTKP